MIAVISDSHVPERSPGIPDQILKKIEEADRVVHCGDLETKEVYRELKQLNQEVVVVKGNCDFFDLPNSEIFSQDNLKFGVYHGTGISPRGDTETLLDIAENKLEVDVLFNGHTHQEEIYESQGTVLLNPGSCTGVGGGSASSSNPTMMVVETEQDLEVKLLEEDKGRLVCRETREFKTL